jgi:hypothetical protein
VICRETGREWTTVDNSLWNSPVEAITTDFTITELKYECAQMLVTPAAPAAVESAFDVLMKSRSKTYLPQKRTQRLAYFSLLRVVKELAAFTARLYAEP